MNLLTVSLVFGVMMVLTTADVPDRQRRQVPSKFFPVQARRRRQAPLQFFPVQARRRRQAPSKFPPAPPTPQKNWDDTFFQVFGYSRTSRMTTTTPPTTTIPTPRITHDSFFDIHGYSSTTQMTTTTPPTTTIFPPSSTTTWPTTTPSTTTIMWDSYWDIHGVSHPSRWTTTTTTDTTTFPPPPTTTWPTTTPTTTTTMVTTTPMIIWDSYWDIYGARWTTTTTTAPTTTPTTVPPFVLITTTSTTTTTTTATTPLPTTTSGGSRCPPCWEAFSARCLRFYPKKKSWTNAKKHCESMGGRLVAAFKSKHSSDIDKMLNKANKRKEIWAGGCSKQDPAWHNFKKGWIPSPSRGPSYIKRTAEGWECVNALSCNGNLPYICSLPPAL